MPKQYYSIDGSIMRPYKVKKNQESRIAKAKAYIESGGKPKKMSEDGKKEDNSTISAMKRAIKKNKAEKDKY
jgi:hypothetical protein